MSAWTANTSVTEASKARAQRVTPVRASTSSGFTRTRLGVPFSQRTVPVSR